MRPAFKGERRIEGGDVLARGQALATRTPEPSLDLPALHPTEPLSGQAGAGRREPGPRLRRGELAQITGAEQLERIGKAQGLFFNSLT